MARICRLNVNGRIKTGNEINLSDLEFLYNSFIENFGHFPVQTECVEANNMPQNRIINKILKDNNVIYNDFCNKFGKVKHVRTESKDYDLFVDKYKNECVKLGRTLRMNELINNSAGLPSGNWFVKNCPDKTVNTYDDFIIWCGFKSNKLKKDKTFVSNKLIELQNNLDREIYTKDINEDSVGFSMIVVNRIFGGIGKAKEEIGLINHQRITDKSKTFEELKCDLKTILLSIKNKEHRTNIILKDITQTKYIDYPSCARRYIHRFNENGEDFYKFVEAYGLKIATNGNGNCYKFDDGEFTKSFLEYKLSCYLKNELGLIYNKDYFRDVRYNTFSKTDRRIDCDYVVTYCGNKYYIEISGMIKPKYKEVWRNKDFKSKGKNQYRDNMILKEQLLKENGCSYFIWFSNDIHDEIYRNIFKEREVV